MSEFSNYLENAILNLTLKGKNTDGSTTVTSGTSTSADPAISVGTTYLALYTTTPSDAGGGTECSYTGYSRETISWGTVGSGSVASDAEISFDAVTGSSITATAVGVFDASTSGNLLYWTALSASKTLNVGDVLSIASGDLTVTID